jgi:FdhE protein
MKDWWDRQIRRADQLASEATGSEEMLTFYAQLLRAQKAIYDHLRSRKDWLPSGSLESDLNTLRLALPNLFETVQLYGPSSLGQEARELSTANSEVVDEMLLNYWQMPTDGHFFPKAALQPYGKWLAESGGNVLDKQRPSGERSCPICGGAPQVSVLQNKESSAESGARYLICANCLSSWEFRRVVCVNCGEERPAKLGYFQSPGFDHVRIEACDSCRHYIKGVDLTRLGLAAPIVDEVYAAPLDLWAREQGYTKIELNLVGL